MTKKNITKKEIAESLSQNTGFPLSFSKKLVDNLLNIMCEQLKKKNLIIKNI